MKYPKAHDIHLGFGFSALSSNNDYKLIICCVELEAVYSELQMHINHELGLLLIGQNCLASQC